MSEMQGLNLSNVCEGKLDRQFKAKYPEILAELKEGQKATMTISLTFERPAGSTIMTSVTSRMTTKMPPSAAVAGLYSFDDDYQIKTETMSQEETGKQGVIQFPNMANK